MWQTNKNKYLQLFQVCGLTGRSYTYSQLRDHSAAFAVRLQQRFNLDAGDTVAICLANCPEYPIAAFGAVEAGLVVTTINPIYTAGKYKLATCFLLAPFNPPFNQPHMWQ